MLYIVSAYCTIGIACLAHAMHGHEVDRSLNEPEDLPQMTNETTPNQRGGYRPGSGRKFGSTNPNAGAKRRVLKVRLTDPALIAWAEQQGDTAIESVLRQSMLDAPGALAEPRDGEERVCVAHSAI